MIANILCIYFCINIPASLLEGFFVLFYDIYAIAQQINIISIDQ
jgi:hypothetical protein